MISSLQPQRPRLQPQFQVSMPLNQQPARVLSSFPPRSQIEAMPPAQTALDASKRHPVFFTDRLVRAPNGVLGSGGSPVAEGYVFNDGVKRAEGGPRL